MVKMMMIIGTMIMTAIETMTLETIIMMTLETMIMMTIDTLTVTTIGTMKTFHADDDDIMMMIHSFTGGSDSARSGIKDITQHLRFCDGGIADEEDVDVASKSSSVRKNLLNAAQQHAKHRLHSNIISGGWFSVWGILNKGINVIVPKIRLNKEIDMEIEGTI